MSGQGYYLTPIEQRAGQPNMTMSEEGNQQPEPYYSKPDYDKMDQDNPYDKMDQGRPLPAIVPTRPRDIPEHNPAKQPPKGESRQSSPNKRCLIILLVAIIFILIVGVILVTVFLTRTQKEKDTHLTTTDSEIVSITESTGLMTQASGTPTEPTQPLSTPPPATQSRDTPAPSLGCDNQCDPSYSCSAQDDPTKCGRCLNAELPVGFYTLCVPSCSAVNSSAAIDNGVITCQSKALIDVTQTDISTCRASSNTAQCENLRDGQGSLYWIAHWYEQTGAWVEFNFDAQYVIFGTNIFGREYKNGQCSEYHLSFDGALTYKLAWECAEGTESREYFFQPVRATSFRITCAVDCEAGGSQGLSRVVVWAAK